MLPEVSQTETSMVHKVAELTKTLNEAADRLVHVEHTFMNAGLTLQNAVNDLQGQISNSSIIEIKDLIRKGFHLSEPEYEPPVETLPTTPDAQDNTVPPLRPADNLLAAAKDSDASTVPDVSTDPRKRSLS